ncbi:hypothetical protein EXIGLDRAFT_837749, partial [Exidia glandulosa HHB12029]
MSSPAEASTPTETTAPELAPLPGISQAQFDDYEKPKTPLPQILHDLILSSPFGQLDVQEIYIELRAQYPYFRVHPEPQVWQNRVRNCLSTSTQFQKVAKPCAKRASFWQVVQKDQPARKRRKLDAPPYDADVSSSSSRTKNRASSGSQTPSGSHSQPESPGPAVMSVADYLAQTAPAAEDEPGEEPEIATAVHASRSPSPKEYDELATPVSEHEEVALVSPAPEPQPHPAARSSTSTADAMKAFTSVFAVQRPYPDPPTPAPVPAPPRELPPGGREFKFLPPLPMLAPSPRPTQPAAETRVSSKVYALTTQLLGDMTDANRTHSLEDMRKAYRQFCSTIEPLLFPDAETA